MKKFLTLNPYRHFLILTCVIFNSCKKDVVKSSNFLSRTLKGEVWKTYNEPTMQLSIRLRMEKKIPRLMYSKQIQDFYARQDYKPVILEHFLENHQLDTLIYYLDKANEHGFSALRFNPAELRKLNALLHSGQIKNKIDAYVALSAMELRAASALSSYSHDLSFGQLDPSKLYRSRFAIKLTEADSAFFDSILSSKDLSQELHNLQPSNSLYNLLKDSLFSLRKENNEQRNPELDAKILKLRINMERLRWRHADTASDFALVNIPSFKLYAFENKKIIWSMGVCVGERKEEGYDEKMKKYLNSRNIDDRPLNHQTPLLTSTFSSIQLNPRWNIPASILQNELYYKLRKNPNYLAENNMKLYKGNKEVGRIDTIHWERMSRENLPFHVRQDAGEFNALGKIKFTFNNPYSIYLHDTPTRLPFKRSVRDVSHGCVRLSDPMKLASWLSRYNGKYAYDLIRIGIGLAPVDTSARITFLYEKHQKEMAENGNKKNTTSVILKKRTPVFIEYYTCWVEPDKGLTFLDDVYQLDDVIGRNLAEKD